MGEVAAPVEALPIPQYFLSYLPDLRLGASPFGSLFLILFAIKPVDNPNR